MMMALILVVSVKNELLVRLVFTIEASLKEIVGRGLRGRTRTELLLVVAAATAAAAAAVLSDSRQNVSLRFFGGGVPMSSLLYTTFLFFADFGSFGTFRARATSTFERYFFPLAKRSSDRRVQSTQTGRLTHFNLHGPVAF